MEAGLLLPQDVGPVDATRVLDFLNRVADAATLIAMVGFSEGSAVADLVARALLERRTIGPFRVLDDVLAVTGVTVARFTEIVTALSGARPAARAPAGSVVVQTSVTRPVLGQRIPLVVQALDPVGRGIPGIEITCVATWGTLAARSGLERQRGSSALLVTDPGGVITLTLETPIAQALPDRVSAVLEAELSRLAAATGPGATARALAAFADHYRAEAAVVLREAVDAVFASYPAEALVAEVGWSVIPATVIAFAGSGSAATVGILTIPVRNWLAAFLAALRASVADDRRMDLALDNIPLDGTTGAVLARDLYGVQAALGGLERGVLGQKFGAEVAGDRVSRFLDVNAEKISQAALVDASRVAGASASAIMTGGFAVFDTIGSIQRVDDTVGRNATALNGLNTQVGVLDSRISSVAAEKADIAAIDALGAQFARETATLDGRITALGASQVTRADLVTLVSRIDQLEATRLTRADLIATTNRIDQLEATRLTRAELDGRLGRLETTAVTRADLANLGSRLSRIEETQVTRADLSALVTRVNRLESGVVTRAELTALETRLTERTAAEIGVATQGLRTDLNARIDAKADAGAVTSLQRSVSGLQTQATQISTRLDGVDTRVTTLGNTRLNRPGP